MNNDLFRKVVEEEMARIEREVGKEKFKKGMYRGGLQDFHKPMHCTNTRSSITLWDHLASKS